MGAIVGLIYQDVMMWSYYWIFVCDLFVAPLIRIFLVGFCLSGLITYQEHLFKGTNFITLKQSFYLLLLLIFSFSAFGQKMKFKKRQILFDKEVAYHFDKTAGKGLLEFRAFAMTTPTGDTILTFKPIELHLDSLPYEKEKRYFNAYHKMKMHETGKSTPIQYSPVGLPNRAFQYMKSTKMLTFNGLDYDQLDDFVEIMGSEQELVDEYDSINSSRHSLYEATVAKYGENAYTPRYDGSIDLFLDEIRVKRTGIGKWKKTGSNRSYVIYMIKNMQGDNIAQLHMKPAKRMVVVLPIVDQERHELTVEATAAATPEDLIKLAATKLVVLGYL